MSQRKCDQCGKPLGPRRKRFCSNKCKDRWHNFHNPRGYGLLRGQRVSLSGVYPDQTEDPGDDEYWMGKDY